MERRGREARWPIKLTNQTSTWPTVDILRLKIFHENEINSPMLWIQTRLFLIFDNKKECGFHLRNELRNACQVCQVQYENNSHYLFSLRVYYCRSQWARNFTRFLRSLFTVFLTIFTIDISHLEEKTSSTHQPSVITRQPSSLTTISFRNNMYIQKCIVPFRIANCLFISFTRIRTKYTYAATVSPLQLRYIMRRIYYTHT